jgi:hypothetical protein
MVALEDVPCACISRGMKSWTAWVHFHRKYSTNRHELNHAQPAGAMVGYEQSSSWLGLVPGFSSLWIISQWFWWFAIAYIGAASIVPAAELAAAAWLLVESVAGGVHAHQAVAVLAPLPAARRHVRCNMRGQLQHVQSFKTCSVICNMCSHLWHVQSFKTCTVIYNMCSHLQHVQSFTTCAVIYNMSSHLQHVQSFTTCAVIYNMSSHLQHVQSFTTCPVIYNMAGYTLIRQLQFSHRSLLHDSTFTATCPGSYDMCSHLQHVQSFKTWSVIATNMCSHLQHVQSFTTYAVIYNMCSLYNMCSHLQHVQSLQPTCAVIYNMCSHLQHVQSFSTCAVIYNMCSHLQHVQSFTTCSSHLKHVKSFATREVIYNMYRLVEAQNIKKTYYKKLLSST